MDAEGKQVSRLSTGAWRTGKIQLLLCATGGGRRDGQLIQAAMIWRSLGRIMVTCSLIHGLFSVPWSRLTRGSNAPQEEGSNRRRAG